MPRTSRARVAWTTEMFEDARICKEKALKLKDSDSPPLKANGKKKGYMEIMINLWEELGYGHFGLTAQNLVDRINQAEKRKRDKNIPIAHTINDELANANITLESTNNENVRNVNNVIPVNDVNARNNDNILDENDKSIYENVYNEAQKSLRNVDWNIREFTNRNYKTRLKNTPPEKTVKLLDMIVDKLCSEYINDVMETYDMLWRLNNIVYLVITSWISVTNVKGMSVNTTKTSSHTQYIPKWLREIDHKIIEKRKFISKCVAERMRLSENGRLTRKLRRNRDKIQGVLNEKRISVVNLTILIEKEKNILSITARRRKKKIKSWKSNELNKKFEKSPSDVYKVFKTVIAADPENLTPAYTEIEPPERKFFKNVLEVEEFWGRLWEKEDVGNPDAEWLKDIEECFKTIIPEVYDGDIDVTYEDTYNSIKKKKNWSSPGPDQICNFWWKKMRSTHMYCFKIFTQMINLSSNSEEWFCHGLTGMIPKEGEWSVMNQRPITCTNNMYKWHTSLLLQKTSSFVESKKLLQLDQRGAKSKVSGTVDNLLIDDMVLRDAQINRRNLSCGWVDITKAFDSVSHSWLKKMLIVHRIPTKLRLAIETIIEKWNVVIRVPTEEGTKLTRKIMFCSGELQGDSLCPFLYVLVVNPVSWFIRNMEGYILAKPISEKVTHSLFIDDLKKYTRNILELVAALDKIKPIMKDAGLEWNMKKCASIHIKNGKLLETADLMLKDGTLVKSLKDEESYKFLGVPESNLHDVLSLFEKLKKCISQHSSVVWSSPLSDYNKILACNCFVNSVAEYYFWSEKFRIADLKELDIVIRSSMNKVGAKHQNQVNELLYLPKDMGGRGLKSLEQTYKETKIKAAVKILTNADPRIKLVGRFQQECIKKKRANIFSDAIIYAKDMDIDLEVSGESFKIVDKATNIEINDQKQLKVVLRKKRMLKNDEILKKCSWQGRIFLSRRNDETLSSGCFNWLKRWKSVPTDVIREIYNLYTQTLQTKTFAVMRTVEQTDTLCRLCGLKPESVFHILNNCGKLVLFSIKQRHDQVLKVFFFEMLKKYELIESLPPWYTDKVVKPYYENEKVCIHWDIPEFTGANEDADERKMSRPDGKIKIKGEKKIFLIEMTCPWLDNRNEKYEEKVQKYKDILANIRREEKGFTVDQITLVIDSLGGYSANLAENISKMFGDKRLVNSIILRMQKTVLSGSVQIARRFKLHK